MTITDLEDERVFLEHFRMHSVNSVADTARYLGSSTDIVYDLIARNEIEVFRAGRKLLVKTRPLLASLGEEVT